MKVCLGVVVILRGLKRAKPSSIPLNNVLNAKVNFKINKINDSNAAVNQALQL